MNVGEFYRISTFRFSFWILFNAQLMNFILRVMFFFLTIQDWRSKFTTQRVAKVLFLL